jgi:hypothetical protein
VNAAGNTTVCVLKTVLLGISFAMCDNSDKRQPDFQLQVS